MEVELEAPIEPAKCKVLPPAIDTHAGARVLNVVRPCGQVDVRGSKCEITLVKVGPEFVLAKVLACSEFLSASQASGATWATLGKITEHA
jgi:hypothetical protein